LPAIFLYFVVIDARSFLGPLNILEIALKVFLSIETKYFS